MSTPSKQELARLKNFAHKCYGYLLPDTRLMDIWNLAYPSLTPVIREAWPLPCVMRNIAHGWLEINR